MTGELDLLWEPIFNNYDYYMEKIEDDEEEEFLYFNQGKDEEEEEESESFEELQIKK